MLCMYMYILVKNEGGRSDIFNRRTILTNVDQPNVQGCPSFLTHAGQFRVLASLELHSSSLRKSKALESHDQAIISHTA
jgi:hypothetical protein